ncbi:MAG: hypothetical protein SFW08_12135 [Gemmatimonadaceae bacterium]|nr:hypothetical protein [Gemmatimonadaceae bacterium]
MSWPSAPQPRSDSAAPPPAAASSVVAIAPAGGIRVGAPFTLVLRTRVPVGTTVAFPVGPDSGVIEAVRSSVVSTRAAGPDSIDAIATYALVAWDVGERRIPFGAVVRERDGVAERVAVAPVPVTVTSVLPSGEQVEPKPAREPFRLETFYWRDALLIALALLVGAALVWWAMRRRPVARPAEIPATRRDPRAALAALDAMQLHTAGEPARVLLGAADAVREALGELSPRARVLTTDELARTPLAGVPMVRVITLLEDADAARYGRTPVSVERATRALAEARALVELLQPGVAA